jgi:hypothetical protein
MLGLLAGEGVVRDADLAGNVQAIERGLLLEGVEPPAIGLLLRLSGLLRAQLFELLLENFDPRLERSSVAGAVAVSGTLAVIGASDRPPIPARSF